ncbi:hypothetical protein J4H86_11365 [Spiractinospora alimapuensis]|uniref:hypothetical protein n=1 Tax=Spiractinospora alimapuensis TaxID=2820884 RepID=UPI001F4879BC|nr:hypothetical protein [Spiractinospora alimapuensis]QVQ54228.1 hypothetical protein J4H86_11365 [Spiractinospora alimapuensis]
MRDTSSKRRVISPGGLLLVAVCFFLPFLTVSCESSFGGGSVTYTGFDLAFNGAPSVSGFGGEASSSDLDDLRAGFQPLAILSLLGLVAGIGLGLALPTPFARWLGGATATLVALASAIAQQVWIRRALDEAIESEASGAGFGITADMLNTSTEFGFTIVLTLLLVVLAYNVVEAVFQARPDLLPGGNGPTHVPPPGFPPQGPPPPNHAVWSPPPGHPSGGTPPGYGPPPGTPPPGPATGPHPHAHPAPAPPPPPRTPPPWGNTP